ncbi:MAG: hypothetical protein K6T51_05930 [Rubrobacteraceae bacterium]|uniref:hypothetical protein n=1 Tax=Rubrobacter naiadicus TaxID=1392641 RepID=UPI002362A919|nr:hypothetical protein [Rubrobacter naiadicus]MBX6764098.1 hypothetical protein [Rubrobacteraceae bacterium]MCL6438127.1 hypothetical protein [Rubrobacteraceae bacterium]
MKRAPPLAGLEAAAGPGAGCRAGREDDGGGEEDGLCPVPPPGRDGFEGLDPEA